MPTHNSSLLISSIIESIGGEMQERGLTLGLVTRRLFALVESGERDVEVLKAAVLEMPDGDLDGRRP